jgi:N-acetylneuraminic acid mutarotase
VRAASAGFGVPFRLIEQEGNTANTQFKEDDMKKLIMQSLLATAIALGASGAAIAGDENGAGPVLNPVPPAFTQGSWTTGAPMPVSRFDAPSVTGVDGRIYAIGGFYTDNPYRPLNHVDAYDPTTDKWVAVSPLGTPRAGIATALGPNGLIYVFGGTDGSFTALNTVEAYDPATGAWTQRTPMPTARAYAGAATMDGLIYVVGGVADAGAGLKTVEAYNPGTDSWSAIDNMPTARYVLAVVAFDGCIYAIAGSDRGQYFDTVEALCSGAWTAKPSLSAARYSPAAAPSPDGRQIYVFGGYNPGLGILATVEAYDGIGWSAETPMPTARYDLGAATSNGRVYAIGGYDAVRPVSNAVEALTP